MKTNLWKLVTVVSVLTMLVPVLVLPTGCAPERAEMTPIPVSVKPTATPVPSKASPEPSRRAEGPMPAASPTDTPTPPPKATPTTVAPPTETSQAEGPPPTEATKTGQVYYVAANEPGANDSNNGLYPTYQGGQDGPWLTIQHAASTMAAGETTYVRTGTYYESGIIFAHSGAPGAPITLANYQSEEVVIDGSQSTNHGFDVSDWPKYGELSYNITLERNLSYDNGVAGFAINSDSHHVVYRNNKEDNHERPKS